MSKDELDAVTRVAIARVRARMDETLTEFKSRELGHTDAESLIESIRQRLHEDLAMMVDVQLVRVSGK